MSNTPPANTPRVFSLATTTDTSAGFTASVRNPTNTASTAPYFSCTDAVTSAGAANTFFVYPLAEAAGTTAADVSTNARPGTYTASGVNYRQPGPCPRNGSRAITLDGPPATCPVRPRRKPTPRRSAWRSGFKPRPPAAAS